MNCPICNHEMTEVDFEAYNRYIMNLDQELPKRLAQEEYGK